MPQRRIAAKSPINDPESHHHRIRVESPLSLEDHTSDEDDSDNNHNNNNDVIGRRGAGNDATHESLLAEDHDHKVRLWKESPFAAGLTEPTWMEERKRSMSRGNGAGRSSSSSSWPRHQHDTTGREATSSQQQQQRIPEDETGCLWISAIICPIFGASRVGNMVVLYASQEKTEDVTIDPETGESTVRRYTRPKLDVVVGPYWPMMLCVTYPLILGVSGWTLLSISSTQKPILIVLVWFLCTATLIVALAFTACRDPGILYRTREAVDESWRWNDPADTYRPPGSWYDGDTAVVVEGFDHTCPWTGTAIGKRKSLFA